MIDREHALEIIDKRDFFNDRAGRELWNDKPKEIQDEDIRNAHEDYELLKEYILNQPKAGQWIPVEEREPSCSCMCLTWVKAKTTYNQYEKCVLANYYDGFFDVFPFDVFPYIDDEPNEVQILAWQPLPELYEVKEND